MKNMCVQGDFSISRENGQYIKGIAILFVILGHLGWLDGAGVWGVHIFCFLSGYGLYCSGQSNGTKHYWLKKLENVYFPYLFCTILFLIAKWLMYGPMKVSVLLASLLGLDFGLNADPTMWYISYIFACYVVFWLYLRISEKSNILAIVVAGVMWLGMAVAGLKGIIWHQGTVAWAYVFSFPLGVAVGLLRNWTIHKRLRDLLCVVVGAVALLVVILRYGKPHGSVELFIYSFAAFAAILTLFWITDFCLLKHYGKIISVVGQYSFFMYLNEAFLLEIRNTYCSGINGAVTGVLVIVLSFLLAVVMSKGWNKVKTACWFKKALT